MEDADTAIQADAPLAAFFTDLLAAKRAGELGPDAAQQLAASGAARILELKAVHRRLCEATDALREAAGEAKTTLDQSSLQLQNLLYEKGHYEKEIATCRGWQSAYSDEQVRPAVRPAAGGRQGGGLDALHFTLLPARLRHCTACGVSATP